MRNGVRRALVIAACCWQAVSRAEVSAPPNAEPNPCREAATESLAGFARASADDERSARIAIIIDDLGYSRANGRRAAQLPGPVAVAVLPHSPHGRELAELAHRAGKEVMVHIPMSSEAGARLDEGGLTVQMDRPTFVAVLREGLQAVPHARGVNNHMGSLLTQHKRPMQWMMSELKSRSLYFVDSRTSARSVALKTAREQNLPSQRRDVFLDNERDCHSIARQFSLLLTRAERQGQSIAIAHPYPETLHFLYAALPSLDEAHIQLTAVSELLSRPADSGPPLDSPPDYVGRLPLMLRPGHKNQK